MSDNDGGELPESVQAQPEAVAVAVPDAQPTEESENVTKEEAEWMRNDLITKARDIQALIITLKKQEEKLKDEVQDFLLREVAEMQVSSELSNRVESAQRASLANPDYVKWAYKNKKGEFQEKTPLTSDASTGAGEFTERLAPTIAVLQTLPEANQPQFVVDIPVMIAQRMASWRGASPDGSAENPGKEEKQLTPQSWASSAEAVEFLETLPTETGLVFFLNGLPLVDTEILRSSVAERETLTRLSAHFHSALASSGTSAGQEASTQYRAWVKVLSHYYSQLPLRQVLASSREAPQWVCTEEENSVCGVAVADYERSASVRVFLLGGRLAAIETMEHRVAVLNAFGLGTKSDLTARIQAWSEEWEITRLEDSTSSGANNSTTQQSTLPKNMVLSLLVSTDRIIVIHVDEWSPSLPFAWHFSWSDLCGIGRMANTLPQDSTELPVVRCTDFEVSRFEPSDPLSQFLLPLLRNPPAEEKQEVNSKGGQQTAGSGTPEASANPLHDSDSKGRSLLLLGLGVAALGALAVGSVMKKRR
jgi:hypothetical protein